MSRRTAGTYPLDAQEAGIARAQAAQAAKALKQGTPPTGATTFNAAWGASARTRSSRACAAPGSAQRFGGMSGRIGAMAIRKDGTILLAGAQGGIWKWTGDPTTGAGTGPR